MDVRNICILWEGGMILWGLDNDGFYLRNLNLEHYSMKLQQYCAFRSGSLSGK